MNKKKIVEIGIICILFLVMAGYAEQSEYCLNEENQIIRGSPGSSAVQVELELDAEGILEKYNYELTIPASGITAEGAKEYFAQAKKEIDSTFFEEGEKADYVTKPVHMHTSYAKGMVKAEWNLDSYEYVDIDGTIISEDLAKEGQIVQATAELKCAEEKESYVFSFHIYPPELSEEEQLLKDIDAAIETESAKKGKDLLTLPEQVDGVQLRWSEKKEHLVWKVLFFEIVVLVLLCFVAAERKRTEQKLRKEQMLLDYSEVVSKLLILSGAGMSLKQAWCRISAQYLDKRQKREIAKRYIFEEMVVTNYEICDGESERRAYQKFADRVELPVYQRLIRILIQNLQTGSRGMCQLLNRESETALEERKAIAQKLGEEAGTKMLLPLMIMLGIVIAIIMVPAIMSFNV